MLLDLVNNAVRIYPEDFPGELVVKTVTLNPLDEPPYLVFDDDEAPTATISSNMVPLNDPDEEPTAHTAYARLPTDIQLVNVISYFPDTGVYNCYCLEVYRVEDADNSLWVAIASEDDLQNGPEGDSDGSYTSCRDDWKSRITHYTPIGAYASVHVRFPGNP